MPCEGWEKLFFLHANACTKKNFLVFPYVKIKCDGNIFGCNHKYFITIYFHHAHPRGQWPTKFFLSARKKILYKSSANFFSKNLIKMWRPFPLGAGPPLFTKISGNFFFTTDVHKNITDITRRSRRERSERRDRSSKRERSERKILISKRRVFNLIKYHSLHLSLPSLFFFAWFGIKWPLFISSTELTHKKSPNHLTSRRVARQNPVRSRRR